MEPKSLYPPELVFFDLRPASYNLCVVLSHHIAEQVSRATKTMSYSVPKSPTVGDLIPIVGHHSIINAEGENWKALRRRYNPGFSPQHLMTLLPQIIDKTSIFCDRLEKAAAEKKLLSLDTFLTNLTVDIIGAVTMATDFDAQSEDRGKVHEIVRVFVALSARFQQSGMGVMVGNPLNAFKKWKLGKDLDRAMKSIIFEQYRTANAPSKEQKGTGAKNKKPRSVLALSFQDEADSRSGLSKEMLQSACDQLKTFLFAGHDTTSIALQRVFYLLHLHPRCLVKIREELRSTFNSSDPQKIAAILLDKGEELIQRLTYTTAVIKETLRLFPPAGTARMAPKGSNFSVRSQDGHDYSLDGMILYLCHSAIQQDQSVFPQPEEWIPERWLQQSGDSNECKDNDNPAAGFPRDSCICLPPLRARS